MSHSGLAGWWYEDLAPLRHITEDLTREKLSWHLIQAIVLFNEVCRISSSRVEGCGLRTRISSSLLFRYKGRSVIKLHNSKYNYNYGRSLCADVLRWCKYFN